LKISMVSCLESGEILTPAMNNPNAIPSSFTFVTANSVGAGLNKLPGASFLEKPSIKMTNTIDMVEMIPNIEVYESSERGRKTVGIRLGDDIVYQAQISPQRNQTHNINPQTLKELEDTVGISECNESP
jgi:hypothetical protein